MPLHNLLSEISEEQMAKYMKSYKPVKDPELFLIKIKAF